MGVTHEFMVQQIREQLTSAGPYINGIDVDAVAREIQDEYGFIDINARDGDGLPVVPDDWFWETVHEHDADHT